MNRAETVQLTIRAALMCKIACRLVNAMDKDVAIYDLIELNKLVKESYEEVKTFPPDKP